jgi:hypothetical protein
VGRLTRWIPPVVGTAIGTVLVGMFVGYLLASAASFVVTDRGWFSSAGESPEARNFMLAYLQRESENVAALRPQQDVVSKALSEQRSQQSSSDVKALSLTYLGGATQGPVSVQIYAVEQRARDGQQGMTTFALTLVGGKVVLVR